ncbi:Uncharacterised protein [Streptococcus pneumoniae]|nr:Uncharacterised protein [Streptococcus pneumoniae]
MKLTETEAIGIHDNHDSRIGNVDPNLNNRRRNQNIRLSLLEILHDLVFFVTLHPTM